MTPARRPPPPIGPLRSLSRRGPTGHRGDAEAGATVVELMISMLILGIAMAMTSMIVFVVSRQSAVQLNQGRATETAQVALSGVEQFLQGAVSPLAAYQAQKGDTVNGTYPGSAAGLCWDESYPGSSSATYPQSPLIADQNATGTTTVSYNGNTVKVVDPSTLSIIYAHDYDVELCGYPTGSTTPVVYEIYLNTGTCHNATYGFCTVDVVKYNISSTNVGGTNCSQAVNWYHAPTSNCATTVDQVPDVWCDAECQTASTEATGPTTYNSCWSYLPPDDGSSQTLPSACSAITTTNESSYTPPLFQYFGPSSDTGEAINSAAAPMDLYCTSDSGSCVPGTSTDDTPNLVQADIQSVELDMSVLSGTGSPITSHEASPGTTVTDFVSLENLDG